ncbi:MAG TPA: saccharopine dehydrogenase C-terminal domain-containing protein [Acidimicrobiia bacterium]|nr:saccharopine dehydrogenase C-terminal domain-containing protein [Acidimicrobiia bacterium]
MTTTVVLGTGIVGEAAIWDLVRRGHDVRIADLDPDTVDRVSERYAVEGDTVDVSDGASVRHLLDGADVVVSAVPYRFGQAVAEAAVATRTHYCDFGGNPSVVATQLRLGAAARDAEIAVVPDCGLAPGLANVLARADVGALGDGTVDRVTLRVGALPAEPVGALGYQLAFNPVGLINEYAEPCEILSGGHHTEVEPLTGIESISVPGIGELEAFHTAGGSSSLPRLLAGRVLDLDYKTLRYPGHGRIFAAMRELGLFDETPDPVTGITPRDVLVNALARNLPSGGPDVVIVVTEAVARDRRSGHLLIDRHDGRFSALARTTAFPATALADVMGGGGIEPGARTMDDAIDAATLMPLLADVGIAAEATGAERP